MVTSHTVSNRFRTQSPTWTEADQEPFRDPTITAVHRSLPEYDRTPLVYLPNLATQLGLGSIRVKDESHRFGLKAFKALGATYAVYRHLCEDGPKALADLPPDRFYRDAPALLPPNSITFTTATDGNHGRGVAWVARKLNQPAVIYMPGNSAAARIEAIRSEGAEVIVVDGTYDDAVALCRHEATRHNRQIISDTSWPGYEQIPRWIQAGYVTLFREIHDCLSGPAPSLILIPGGVGALAATAAWWYRKDPREPSPLLVCVEPEEAACLLESAASPDGTPQTSAGKLDSIMAGLNCGTPSPVAWPFVRQGFDLFLTVPDKTCLEAVRLYYRPLGDDPRLVSGESGAATLAGLLALVKAPAPIRRRIGLGPDTHALLLNTEGDTDPEAFARLVAD